MDSQSRSHKNGIILVHGGQNTARCWDPTVDVLKRLRPDLEVLAVNLPGRAGDGVPIGSVTITDCVGSVVRAVKDAGVEKVMLVGHSMAGVTLPGVAAALGAEQVSRLVFIAAAAPPEGASIFGDLSGELESAVEVKVTDDVEPVPFGEDMIRTTFCNGMQEDQVVFLLDQWCAESPLLATEVVDRTAMPEDIPRSWILTTRDQAVPPDQQRQHIVNLGGVQETIEIDACHSVMVEKSEELGRLLAQRI